MRMMVRLEAGYQLSFIEGSPGTGQDLILRDWAHGS